MEYFTIPEINCEENLRKKFQRIVKNDSCFHLLRNADLRFLEIYGHIFRNLIVEIRPFSGIQSRMNRIRIFVWNRFVEKNLSEMYGIHEWGNTGYSMTKTWTVHKHIEGGNR